MIARSTAIQDAAGLIRSGEIVVFPTETVYGLGANALDEEAVARIFAAKGRPADNPLIVHFANADQVSEVALEIYPVAHRLLQEFSPGPLTVVLPARPELPRIVTAGLDTVAVRVPGHPVAQDLLREAGVPVAAPSANRSGEPSPTTVEMARKSLGPACPAYLDGGPCEVGLESTVLRVTDDNDIHILRPGAVTEADILELLPGATVHLHAAGQDVATPGEDGPVGAARSPGLRHRHYQPAAAVRLWETAEELRTLLGGVPAGATGAAVAVIVPAHMKGVPILADRDKPAGRGDTPLLFSYESLQEYARNLYGWFTESDTRGVARILAHLPADGGLGTAIRDRLGRASGN